MQVKNIGDSVVFTTPYSESGARTLCGTIVGRNWSFDTLVSYVVETLSGTWYHVNANTLEGGHGFKM